MSESALTPRTATENLRLKKTNDLSEKERQDLLERYSLEELIKHFGRWPTYYLLLRQTTSVKPGKLLFGAGLAGAIGYAVKLYLTHPGPV